MISFIYDIDEDKAVGVIQTEITTAHQIQNIIDIVKNRLSGEYTWGDIEAKLPKDCKVYWLGVNEIVRW